MNISDIIDAKRRVLARYSSPESIQQCIREGKSELDIRLENIDRDITLSEIVIELCKVEIEAQKATTPVNVESK